MINPFQSNKKSVSILLLSFILCGNSFSADNQNQNVAPLVQAAPLTVNKALQIAIGNNPGSQDELLLLAFNIKKAYFEALAAKQSLHYMEQIKEAALSSSLLGQHMVKAGNWSTLQLANEQVLNADMKIKAVNSKLKLRQALDGLAQLMKLQNVNFITLPEQLPELPNEILSIKQSEPTSSNVQENFLIYNTKFEIAKIYRDEIIPNRKLISKENLLLYNGMLISPFELLKDKTAQILSIQDYIAALKDFWIANAALEFSMKIPANSPEVNDGV